MTKIVYKVTNKETDQVYIGITSKSIEERKKDHYCKALKNQSNKFFKAISTYDENTFNWEQIDTADNSNELARKEKSYILKYNSKNTGFNSDSGGGIKKTIYKYDLRGSYIESFDCLKVAGESVGVKKQQISRACLNRTKCKKFYWSYDFLDKFKGIEIDKRNKEVIQLTLDGEYVAEFNSVSEASKLTGFNKTSISKVCRGERNKCGGFKWMYK